MRKEVIGDCELYLGDCLEILPTLPKVDAVITDPPYGIGAAKMSLGKWRTSRMEKMEWDAAKGDLSKLPDAPAIVWGGNYFDLPPSRGFLIWDKGRGFKGRDFAECEMAWRSDDCNARIFSYDPLAMGDYRDKQHPTQKPVAVMVWSIMQIGDAETILDPFMGSGTTALAAMAEGFSFVGIEREAQYVEIAKRRIEGDAPLFAEVTHG